MGEQKNAGKQHETLLRRSQVILYGGFFAVVLLLHFSFTLQTNDDIWFLNAIHETPIFPLLQRRYETWTSRIILEFFSFNLVKHLTLWRILDSLMMLLTVWSLHQLVSDDASDCRMILCCFLAFFLIPFSLYSSAGWVVTSLVYVWPTACLLFSLVPVKKILQGKRVSCVQYVTAFAALIFALNMEQSMIILFGLDILMLGYTFWWLPSQENKTVLEGRCFFILRAVIEIVSVIFTFTCPGNFARKAKEVVSWFPDFDQLSLVRKMEMGFSSTLFYFVFQPNVLFCVFCICLCACVWVRCQKSWVRVIAVIPLATTVVFGMMGDYLKTLYPQVYEITQAMTSYGTFPVATRIKLVDFIPDAILLVVALSVLLALWFSFENTKTRLICGAALLLGFASRMAMSFSPTIWASYTRTYTYMCYTVVFVLLFLVRELWKNRHIAIPASALGIFGTLGLLREIMQ